MSTSKLSAYANALQNEKSKKLLEDLYAANPTAGSIYDLDVAAADAAHAAGKTQLDENRKAREAALQKNRAAQKRAASYSYAKLLNYLPEQLKAQGLHGQGVGQSALLNAYGSYRNEVAGAEADYADRVSALEAAYKTDLSGLDATRDAAHHTALQNYITRADNSSEKAALNERVMEEIELKLADAEASGDWTEAREYLEKVKDYVDEDTYTFLSSKIPEVVTAEEGASKPSEDEGLHKFIYDYNISHVGIDQVRLSDGGETMLPSAEITEADGRRISEEMDVRTNAKQAKAVAAVLLQSASWGTEKNGTLVKFNVGAVYKDPQIYMFYNGRWIKVKSDANAKGVVDAKEYLKD